jgi:hypothetical protein
VGEKVVGQAGIGFEELLDSRWRTVLHADVLLLAALFMRQLVVNATVATDLVTLPIKSLLSF